MFNSQLQSRNAFFFRFCISRADAVCNTTYICVVVPITHLFWTIAHIPSRRMIISDDFSHLLIVRNVILFRFYDNQASYTSASLCIIMTYSTEYDIMSESFRIFYASRKIIDLFKLYCKILLSDVIWRMISLVSIFKCTLYLLGKFYVNTIEFARFTNCFICAACKIHSDPWISWNHSEIIHNRLKVNHLSRAIFPIFIT